MVKTGDRVEIIESENTSYDVGEKGTVLEFNKNEPRIGIKFDKYNKLRHSLNNRVIDGFGWWVNDKHLKVIASELKVGDRVVIVNQADCPVSDIIGKKGTIVIKGITRFGVKFDVHQSFAHDLDESIPYGFGYWIDKQNVRIISDECVPTIFDFKVGDRVKVLFNSKFGVINKVYNTKQYEIRYDNDYGICCCTPNEIELIEPRTEEMKMNKPETQLEKTACKDAVEDEIKKQIEVKKKNYALDVGNFVSAEKSARSYRKSADELKKALGITDIQMKEMF